MLMEKVLTIIVPTYNMERYLSYCLDSLLIREMSKMEVLIINDGSKDRSSTIAHTYQEQYPQTFRVIDKDNGNYGSCINIGVKEAIGKYIKILDADDSFETSSLDAFVQELTQIDADLIVTDFYFVDEERRETGAYEYYKHCPHIPQKKTFNFVNFINQDNIDFKGQMHAFAYRTEIIRGMHYHQTEGISYTDQEWVFMPITEVKSCHYIPFKLYKYLYGRNGQTVLNIGKSINQLMTVVFSLVTFYVQREERKNVYKRYELYQIKTLISSIYTACLYHNAFPLGLLREFDQKLKAYPSIYHLVDNAVAYHFPFYIKYISYWRKHTQKGLPTFFMLNERLRTIARKILHK